MLSNAKSQEIKVLPVVIQCRCSQSILSSRQPETQRWQSFKNMQQPSKSRWMTAWKSFASIVVQNSQSQREQLAKVPSMPKVKGTSCSLWTPSSVYLDNKPSRCRRAPCPISKASARHKTNSVLFLSRALSKTIWWSQILSLRNLSQGLVLETHIKTWKAAKCCTNSQTTHTRSTRWRQVTATTLWLKVISTQGCPSRLVSSLISNWGETKKSRKKTSLLSHLRNVSLT